MRVVIDTNVLVSAIIRPQGTTGQVLRQLQARRFDLLMSRITFDELVDVLFRPRLRAKYQLADTTLRPVLRLIYLRSVILQPNEKVTACRDPKDDIYLELAIAGKADYIVTGDADLLVLHPFRGIPIIVPATFLTIL